MYEFYLVLEKRCIEIILIYTTDITQKSCEISETFVVKNEI